MELSTSASLLISPSRCIPTVFAGRLPQPTRLPLTRSRGFHHASGTTRPSDSSTSIPSHFALAYRVSCRGATRGPAEVSQGHALVFHTVPSANTLVRWVDESAFASILQARPCPTFGRPVRPGVAPSTTARYCSASPSDPTSRWAPCPPQLRRGGSRSTLAVSGFRLRARLGVSIPATCGRRGITPAFGYDPPHPGVGGISTLPTSALPGAHYGPLGLPLRRPRFHLRLMRAALPRLGPRRRVSRVPSPSVSACCAPYPAETSRTYAAGPGRGRRGLPRARPQPHHGHEPGGLLRPPRRSQRGVRPPGVAGRLPHHPARERPPPSRAELRGRSAARPGLGRGDRPGHRAGAAPRGGADRGGRVRDRGRDRQPADLGPRLRAVRPAETDGAGGPGGPDLAERPARRELGTHHRRGGRAERLLRLRSGRAGEHRRVLGRGRPLRRRRHERSHEERHQRPRRLRRLLPARRRDGGPAAAVAARRRARRARGRRALRGGRVPSLQLGRVPRRADPARPHALFPLLRPNRPEPALTCTTSAAADSTTRSSRLSPSWWPDTGRTTTGPPPPTP